MNSVASSAVLGLVACAAYGRVRNVQQQGTACRQSRVPARGRAAGDEALQRHCFVEGAMIAPSINDEVLLKEEQP